MNDEPGFPPADCRPCGRCCFSELPEYVRVFGVDWDRMGERAQEHAELIGNRMFMKMRDGHCTALAIDIEGRTFSCSIYEERPDVCRSLERGSGQCRADWIDKAARPDVALERLRASRGSR
ncbi:MAG TPA: YkgJ family cysteine cluster protein [Polyangiaceae bacterium]|nr:YkgJ family cysteine cluster protein [Polyangiaceae bacterium]